MTREEEKRVVDFNRADSMKIQFHIRGLTISRKVRSYLGQPLERLQRLIPISRAAVILEHSWDNAPAFRAFVLLAVPGPDIHAEVRGHTLEAAWLKITAALRKQIEKRKAKQLARTRHVRSRPMFNAPWSRGGILR